MPYTKNDELPASIRGHLPEHAQTIFRAAFNNAHTHYGDDEQRAFKVAWAAVKHSYEKDDAGNWKEKK